MLLLRITLGATAIGQGGFYLYARENSVIWVWVFALSAIVCGISLLLGFLTPVSGLLVSLGSIFFVLLLFPAADTNLLAAIYVITVSAAVVMLGPGAFSLDARMFGRREIIIPPPSRSPKS